MKILGISAFYHDSSVALIDDEKIVFASQEERFQEKNMIKNSQKIFKISSFKLFG